MTKMKVLIPFAFVLFFAVSASAAPSCSRIDEVLSANQCWMNRNLGASRVATSLTDSEAYGDLYQWGRPTDGHQNRNSLDTTITSSHDVPGHRYFIKALTSPHNWRVPPNDILWQGLGGINNPCPQGFRLPSRAEWEKERSSWSSDNALGAFASPLKLVLGGHRYVGDGLITMAGVSGGYWSSTIIGTDAYNLSFSTGGSGMYPNQRAIAFSIRCIKDN